MNIGLCFKLYRKNRQKLLFFSLRIIAFSTKLLQVRDSDLSIFYLESAELYVKYSANILPHTARTCITSVFSKLAHKLLKVEIPLTSNVHLISVLSHSLKSSEASIKCNSTRGHFHVSFFMNLFTIYFSL